MSVIVCPLHHYHRPDHLEHVIAEMHRRGAPVLRAHFDGEAWFAREGTHRLRAALLLGFVPVLVPVPWPRTLAALERARFAAMRHSHLFDRIEICSDVSSSHGRPGDCTGLESGNAPGAFV